MDGFIANVAHTFVIGVAQVGSMLFSFVVLGRGMLPFGFSCPLVPHDFLEYLEKRMEGLSGSLV